MRHGQARAALGLLLGVLLQACDRESPVAPDAGGSLGTVEFDLGAQPGCVSVIAEAVLTVTPEIGTPRELRQDVPAGATTVTFDAIEVERGTVEFAAQILSNNGTLLYSNQASMSIDAATFSVPIEVQKQAPVLEVCPGQIVFDRPNLSFTPLQVSNRGIGTLIYQAVSPECDAVPCLTFEVPGDSVLAGATGSFFVFLPRMVPQESLELLLQSEQGSVPVSVALPQLPELVPVSLDSTGSHLFFPDSVVVPVRVVIRNDGNVAATGFKLAAFWNDSEFTENRFVTAFHLPGQADQFYPFITASLAPGDEMTLDGLVMLTGVGSQSVDIRIEVDSCIDDGLLTTYCRIDEFDESNNMSGTIPAFIPSD